ncbi:MAG: sterol desaturase family protein [Actinomycetota bacterium]|nr:sterol desaturase family protein [Actinomycetota bacterium]
MASTRSESLSSSPPMFTSRLLNSLTRTHPVVPLVLYAPVICALAVLGVRLAGLVTSVGLMVAGYLTWTLSEYWVHRVVFHFQPRGPRSESLVWAIHGMHHAYPHDPQRVVTAPVASIPIGAGAAALFWWVMPGSLWLPFAAGWGGGYLAYDLLHAYLHVGRPRSALLRWLRARHLRHHFADSRGDFGVSAPYWDYVFGTSLPGRPARRRENGKAIQVVRPRPVRRLRG